MQCWPASLHVTASAYLTTLIDRSVSTFATIVNIFVDGRTGLGLYTFDITDTLWTFYIKKNISFVKMY